MSFLVLLPILTFLNLLLRFAIPLDNPNTTLNRYTYAFVLSSTIWGLLVTASSELLSLVGGITRVPIAIFWLGALSFVSFRASLPARVHAIAIAIKDRARTLDRFDKFVLSCLGVILILTFSIAIISPPNNADSLLYHMARVGHWAQDQGLYHYATAYDHQLFMPIWAETAILQLRILFGSDQLSNLIQWFSYVGCIIVAASIARLLKFPRKAQIVSAVFAATIPLALLESTSTQNDLVVAYWLSCLAFLILYASHKQFNRLTTLMIAAVTGLGILTKVTFYVYALPAWIAIISLLLMNYSKPQVLGRIGSSVVVILAINAGFWARNLSTYGNPIGPSEIVKSSATLLSIRGPVETVLPEGVSTDVTGEANLGSGGRDKTSLLEWFGVILREEKRMVMWNLAVPLSPLRDRISAVDAMLVLTLDQDQYSNLDAALWNHEDTVGNPLQLVLIALAIPALLALARNSFDNKQLAYYGALILLGYILLPVIISNAATIFGIRFQLPFFILASPLISALYLVIPTQAVRRMIVFSLLVFALPWLLFNNTRPIIGWQPFVTRVNSVFLAGNDELLFAMRQGEKDEYQAITSALQARGCKQIGLDLDSHDYEYLFWHLLDAPESGNEIRSLTTSSRLSRYLDSTYAPCGIICTQCEGEKSYRDLPLWEDYGSIQLYLGNLN